MPTQALNLDILLSNTNNMKFIILKITVLIMAGFNISTSVSPQPNKLKKHTTINTMDKIVRKDSHQINASTTTNPIIRSGRPL